MPSFIARIQLWHILLLAFLLLSSLLFDGLANDDYFHYFLLSDNPPLAPVNDSSLWGLFSFASQDHTRNSQLVNMGIMPWWVSEDFSWRFFRPLTEISLYIDHVWLRDNFALIHFHSIAVYLVVITLAYIFFGVLIKRQDFRILATLLFAIDGAHGVAIAWICARSLPLAAMFILLFMLCHHRAIQANLNKAHALGYGFLALLAFGLSLLTAEAGVVSGVYLFAYTLFLDKRSWLQRLIHWLPYGAIALAWLVAYLSGHYGVVGGNDMYLSPNQQPLAFTQRLLEIIFLVGFNFWTSFPTDFYSAHTHTSIFLALGAVGIALGIVVFRHHQERAVIAFLAVCALLSLIPVAGAPLQDRNLLLTNLSLAPLMALVILAVMDRLQQGKVLAKTTLIVLLITQIVINLLWLPLYSRSLSFIEHLAVTRAKTLQYTADDQLVFISAPVGETLHLAPRLLYHNGKLPKTLWNLTGEAKEVQIDVIDEHSIQLSSQEGFISAFGEFVRSLKDEPLQVSQTIIWDGLSIQIDALNALGQPTVFTARFATPVEKLRFFEQRRGYFGELDLFNKSQ